MFKVALVCVRLRAPPLLPRSLHLHHRHWRQPPTLRRTAAFFPWSNPTPSLDTAAEIAALEARANAHPSDLSHQLALLKALNATRTKHGYDTVIDRWEHAAEHVCPPPSLHALLTTPQNPTSPLLRSDDAFEIYLDALASSGRQPAIDTAVRKRQSLLDSLPLSSDTTPSNDPPAPQSRSEKIAAELLARRANSNSTTPPDQPPPNPAIANLAAALGKGAGVSGNPIYVTLSERERIAIPFQHLTHPCPQPRVPSQSALSVSSSWPVWVASVCPSLPSLSRSLMLPSHVGHPLRPLGKLGPPQGRRSHNRV